MRKIQSLAISTAMVVIAVLGFIGIASYAGIGIVDELKARRLLQQDERLTGLAVSVGALTHELQKERGASAGFIASKGQNFVEGLPKQRENSDRVIAEFRDAVGLVLGAEIAGPDLKVLINDVLAQLDALAALRGEVDSLSIALGDAVGTITRLNRSAIGLLPEMGKSISYSAAAKAVQRHAIFMTAKDIVGLERAVGATGFALARAGEGVFPPNVKARFDALIIEKQALLQIYGRLASDELLALLNDYDGSEVKARVSAMVEIIASENAAQITAIAPEEWFATITEMINVIKSIEDAGASEIQGFMEEAVGFATDEIVSSFILLALVGGIFVLMTGYLAKRAAGSMQLTSAQVLKLADGDIDSPIALAPQRDLKKITDALETFRTDEVKRRETSEANKKLEIASAEGIKRITGAVADGDFSSRLRLRNMDGASLILGNGVNEILDVAEQVVTTQKERDRKALLDQEREAEEQKKATEALRKVVIASSEGDFTKSMDASGLDDMWREVADGINSISRTTNAALTDISRIMTGLSDGDLRERMADGYRGTFYDIAESTNGSLKKLELAFNSIEGAVQSMSNAAAKIRSGTEQLAKRSGDQSQTVERSREATERINSTIDSNRDRLEDCRQTVTSLEDQMQASREVAKGAIHSMSAIEKASGEMNTIVGTIEEIAFQTNLLALNASVEAARAGESGKGFSVVASEVRALATRCSAASNQISELIAESVSEISEGASNVQQTGEAIDKIQRLLEQVLNTINDISDASEEQERGMRFLNDAIEQMDEISQSNSTLAKENSHLMETFSGHEDDLLRTLESFLNRADEVGETDERAAA